MIVVSRILATSTHLWRSSVRWVAYRNKSTAPGKYLPAAADYFGGESEISSGHPGPCPAGDAARRPESLLRFSRSSGFIHTPCICWPIAGLRGLAGASGATVDRGSELLI